MVSFKRLKSNENFNVIILAVGHNEYRSLTLKKFSNISVKSKKKIFADLKNIYKKNSILKFNFDYMSL